MRTEDGSVIQECLKGDPSAFGMLVDKYKAGIYAFVYDKLRDFRDAQDVTQEVFEKAYRNLRSLRHWESFTFWLYRIARNLCRNWIRSQSRRPDQEFIEDQDPAMLEDLSLSSYRENQAYKSLHEALDSLPDAYREVLLLHYFGGMNIKDMARSLGASPTAIGMRLSRARAQLREEMVSTMGSAFGEQKLQLSFTFRVVEAVKRIKVSPMPRMAGLPWGLSLATVTIITILSLNPHLSIPGHIAVPTGSPLPVDTRVLKKGEIPVDILNTSEIPVISTRQFDGDGLGSVVPGLQNALFMAPQAEGGTWTRKADMPTARQQLSVCAVNGKIYAIGGWDGGDKSFSTVEEYDPVADIWERKSDKPTPYYEPGAWVMDNRIYTFNEGEMQQYEPEIDRWTKLRDTDAVNSYYHSVSFVNGKVYVIGGYIVEGGKAIAISTVYEYDPIADKWAEKADMPTARLHLSTCVCNGKIYAIGGWDGIPWNILSNVEEYDPIADKWTKKANMSAIRHSLVTCAVKGRIYAIGGVGVDGPGPRLVEEYDPITDTWTRKPDMPTGRWFSAGCVVNGKIYVIGGTNAIQNPPPLSILEVYDPGTGESINPEGKLPTTWGDVRTVMGK